MMSKDATPVAESVEVTQADREAAAGLFCEWFNVVPHSSSPTNMRCGNEDDHAFVQAFARHRLAAYEAGCAEGVRAAAEVAFGRISTATGERATGFYEACDDIATALRAISKEPTK